MSFMENSQLDAIHNHQFEFPTCTGRTDQVEDL